MILSLFPVSNRKLPFGCRTTKKPTGTGIGLVEAPDCRALFAIVSPPELNAYIFMPAGAGVCAKAGEATSRIATAKHDTVETILRIIRFSSAARCFRSEDGTAPGTFRDGCILPSGLAGPSMGRSIEMPREAVKVSCRCRFTSCEVRRHLQNLTNLAH